MTENNSEPFIAIDFWIKHSDILIEHNEKYHFYLNKINEIFSNKNEPIVIFLKTDLLLNYFELLFSLEKSFILITASNDDHCPPYLKYPASDDNDIIRMEALLEKPELVFWFAKNPCIKHRKLSAYPLGPKWQWKTTRFFGEDKTKHLKIYNSLCKTPKQSLLSNKKKLLYFNFNQTSNNPLYSPHKNIRHTIKNELIKRFAWNKNEPFEKYINEIYLNEICISPPGRGIDTHRCWEALMMGTIPLLSPTPIDDILKDLPVIIIDDWKIVTEEFLNKQYEIILKKIDQYNFKLLYTDYWIDMLSSKKKDHEVGWPPL